MRQHRLVRPQVSKSIGNTTIAIAAAGTTHHAQQHNIAEPQQHADEPSLNTLQWLKGPVALAWAWCCHLSISNRNSKGWP